MSEREVLENGKINIGTGNCSSEASSLFPGPHHRSPNRVSNETGITQTRSLRKADEVGHRAKRVQHQIQAENCNKGAGPSQFLMEFAPIELSETTQAEDDLPIWKLCRWSLECTGKRSRPNSDLTRRDR